MLISNAYAQAAGGAGDPLGGLMGLPFMLLMFVVMWFVMIRPQMKKAKEHQKLVEKLAKGDEVLLQSGLVGRIVAVGENYLTVALNEPKDSKAASFEVFVQKGAVTVLLPKGTLKNL